MRVRNKVAFEVHLLLLKIMDYKNKLLSYTRKRSFKYGLPFVIFVVGGSFGLKEFTDLRYRYRPVKSVVREEVTKLGIEMKKPGEVTIETEYEKVKEMDIDHWKNVRIPRPWEEDGKEV